jgi:hypothetical protein
MQRTCPAHALQKMPLSESASPHKGQFMIKLRDFPFGVFYNQDGRRNSPQGKPRLRRESVHHEPIR